MASIKELMIEVESLKSTMKVLEHAVEYLESNFRSTTGGEPKKLLVRDDKIQVPDESFEMAVELILKEYEVLKIKLDHILNFNIQDNTNVKD